MNISLKFEIVIYSNLNIECNYQSRYVDLFKRIIWVWLFDVYVYILVIKKKKKMKIWCYEKYLYILKVN